MIIYIIHVGDPKESYYKEAFGEYKKRISAFSALEDILVKPYKMSQNPDSAEIETALSKEGEVIEKLLSQPSLQKAQKIALCIEGDLISSEDLADLFEEAQNYKNGSVAFIIGGSRGLSNRVKALCDKRISFSKMTFAHNLFRVMLAEQIYRALGILNNTKYHK